jgi:hypothetical protein
VTVLVEFVELGREVSYRSWPEAAQAPSVADQVEIMPSDTPAWGDEVVATVERRQWFNEGRGVVCYVSSR